MLSELAKIDHPNLVQYFDWREDDYNFYTVFEEIKGGEVFERIGSFGEISENYVAEIMRQVFSAIFALH